MKPLYLIIFLICSSLLTAQKNLFENIVIENMPDIKSYPSCDKVTDKDQDECSNPSPLYYLPVTIGSEEGDFVDKVVEIELDLERLNAESDDNLAIDPGSIRVHETDEGGKILNESVIYQFEKEPNLSRSGTLVFLVKGSLDRGTLRFFMIVMEPVGGDFPPPLFRKSVDIKDHIMYQGQRSFRIKTPAATYLYHRNGAGFAGMIDREGQDWISYRPGLGSAGEYRGIPNIRPAGFHPGYENHHSRILQSGPLKLTIESETEDNKWTCRWEIYPAYATMTLSKKDTGRYWLLYEGTPAGKLDVDRDYWVRSDGKRGSVSVDWTGVLPDPEWVWFGDESCHRVLFLAKHEYDQHPDQFWQMQGNMTVFGFGRKPHEHPGTYMEEVPVHLTIGFVESTNYTDITKHIRSAILKPVIKLGKIQKRIIKSS